mmetsp:Transcript_43158/g.92043  ORF Transcript_43158/g.92043 Transcript_43158/m.92043 type:complete len:113 (+) Transcript_43158:373-711(+)
MIILSFRRYWKEVEEEVNITQVEEVATATAGSTPMRRKKGAKMRPPPTPTSPARMPVATAMMQYLVISPTVHPARLQSMMQKYRLTATVAITGSAMLAARRATASVLLFIMV